MTFQDHVVETSGLPQEERAEVCRLTIRTLEDTVVRFETDIPWAGDDPWPPRVRDAAEILVTASGGSHTDESYQQTGVLQRGDESVWDAFATFAGYAYDASAWSDTRALPIVSLADAGDLVVRVDDDELERLRTAVRPVRVLPLKSAGGRVSWKDWVAAVGGVLVALLLFAQLLVTVAWDARLGTSPGFFVLGLAVLVMSAAIVFDREGKRPFVGRIVKGLLAAAVVLIIAGLLQVI